MKKNNYLAPTSEECKLIHENCILQSSNLNLTNSQQGGFFWDDSDDL